MSEFNVHLLPAAEGDCLLVEYGQPGRPNYVLIDAGRAWTYKNVLKAMLAEIGVTKLELLVVTHVDRDHIDGMLSLFSDTALDLKVEHVWFNTYDHLIGNAVEVVDAEEEDLESFGAKMGEALSPLIVSRGWRWNAQFGGFAAALADSPASNVFQFGNARITLLSPDRDKLALLTPVWEAECRKAGIAPGASLEEYVVDEEDIEGFGAFDIEELATTPFVGDQSRTNGSSIAFMFEYEGRRVLFGADAHADLLVRQLTSLGASAVNPLAVDAFKIPHHGSQYNLSRELLELLSCKRYLVSTNGNYFKHPDDVAMARLVKFGTKNAQIHFNYTSDYNRKWGNPGWEAGYEYKAIYPAPERNGYQLIRL
jgi:beta-lactamase superfamily II metal-dependent hydrolase